MGENAVRNHYVMPLLAIENIDVNFIEEDEDQELFSLDTSRKHQRDDAKYSFNLLFTTRKSPIRA